MNSTAQTAPLPWHKVRRIELDWLRVIAFGLLIFYHVGMLYAYDWGWHYKSSYSSEFLRNIMLWSNQWRMSLLFLISGVAVSYLLHNMEYWRFYFTRHSKLFLPLVFGMAVVVVPQVYVEMSAKGLLDGIAYGEFWLAYLDQNSPLFENAKTSGNLHITWNHLWFLMYIFSYSLILWLLFPLLNAKFIRPLWRRMGDRTPIWCLLVGPIIAFYVIGVFLWESYPTTHALVDDWYNHAKSFTCFILGFALVRAPRLWTSFADLRWPTLQAALVSYAYILFSFNGGSLGEGALWNHLETFLWGANRWLWLVTIIAWAQHSLTTGNPLLKYLNGGVYCFYILHQTIIVAFAYYLVPLEIGPVLEPLLVITATSGFCWLGYEFIKRIPFVSALFGVVYKKPVTMKVSLLTS